MRGYIVGILAVLGFSGMVYSCCGHGSTQNEVFGTVEEVRLVVAGQPSDGNDNTGNVITGALAGGAIAQTVGGSDLVLPGAAVGAAIAGGDTVRGQITAAQMIVTVGGVRFLFMTMEERYTPLIALARHGDQILLQRRENRGSNMPFNFEVTSVEYGWEMNEWGNGGVRGIMLPSRIDQK